MYCVTPYCQVLGPDMQGVLAEYPHSAEWMLKRALDRLPCFNSVGIYYDDDGRVSLSGINSETVMAAITELELYFGVVVFMDTE